MLASLGIEKGKPYDPDEKTKKAMRQAVVDACYLCNSDFSIPMIHQGSGGKTSDTL